MTRRRAGISKILMNIGALGDGNDRDAAMGEMDGGAAVGINPGAEDHVRLEVAEGLLKSITQRGGHEEMVYRAADLGQVGGRNPAGPEGEIIGPRGEALAAPWQNGAWREDA